MRGYRTALVHQTIAFFERSVSIFSAFCYTIWTSWADMTSVVARQRVCPPLVRGKTLVAGKALKTYKYKIQAHKRNRHLQNDVRIISQVHNHFIALCRRHYRIFGQSEGYKRASYNRL